MDPAMIRDSYQLIKKDFSVEANFDDDPDISYDRLYEWLVAQIRKILDHDFETLLHAMYRIDVSEQRLKTILELGDVDTLANSLADLIIQRQMQKVETRRRYAADE